MTEVYVHLSAGGGGAGTPPPPATADGDTSLSYVDLCRVWYLEAGQPISVTINNAGADNLNYEMTVDVVRID